MVQLCQPTASYVLPGWYLVIMKSVRRLFVACAAFGAAAGGSVLLARKRLPAFGEPGDDRFAIVAAMDEARFSSESTGLVQGSAVALFGGVELDLTEAEASPAAHLTLRAIFGGIDVVVPRSWRVEIAGRSVMGGIANLTAPDGADDDAPVLLIDAVAVFGGIEVHAADDG